MLQLVE